jgi:amino acid transporter
MSTAVIGTFVIGHGDTGLADRWIYVLPATLVALWLAVALNIVGLRTGRWLQNLGAVGTYLPGLVLIALGVYAALTRPSATRFDVSTIIPDLSNYSELNLWASIAFAFAGLELCACMGDEIRDPRRNLPRALYISAPLIAFLYIAGTVSVLWLIPAGSVNIVSGFQQALAVGATHLNPNLGWIAAVCAALYVLGNVGGVGAWLTGPARIAFVIGLDRYFPPAFGRVHPRWHTPYVAILTQGVLATFFLFISVVGKGTTVEKAYLVVLDTMLLIYFVPYLYLFTCYIVVRWNEARAVSDESWPHGRAGATLVGLAGLGLTLFAMVIATIPPADTDPWVFRAKVIGGAAIFVAIGGLIYWRGRR